MFLSAVIEEHEQDMVCDLAEYYHVFFYREYPCYLIATLVAGLRDESRVMQKMSGMTHINNDVLLGGILDRLSYLVWFQTKDGSKGKNRPKSMVEIILPSDDSSEKMNVKAFESAEEFEEARYRILKKGE